MKFCVPSSSKVFTIPDDWWQFCDCPSFRRKTDFYMYPPQVDSDVTVVPIDDVQPPERDAGTEQFKKGRLVSVLFGLQSQNGMVPPVEVDEVPAQCAGRYKYRVRNGFHRFYASVALGFPQLPVTTKVVVMSTKE
jgi:hypothetical protein